MEGGVIHSRLTFVNSLLRVSGQTINHPFDNHKLEWVVVVGANTDVRAWIMSSPVLNQLVQSNLGPGAEVIWVGDKSRLEAQVGTWAEVTN